MEIARQTGITVSKVSKPIKTLYNERIISFDPDNISWRKEIHLIVDPFYEVSDSINSAIAVNMDYCFDDKEEDID